jgi:RNA polymerase sigma-70 factor (ECF subfamily)
MGSSGTSSGGAAAGGVNERDRRLFDRFVAGDQEAFRELYSLYERPLIVYCRHLMPNQNEAQDVFQETWLRVVRVRRREETVEHFRAMLFTIARNVALNRLHSLKVNPASASLNTIEAEGEWLTGTEEGHYSEVEGLVNQALKRLPLLQREAFMLHAVLGYTFQEIAEMQGGSMSAAKTRAFRARSYLRKLLSNWLGLAEDDIDDEDLQSSPSPHLLERLKR